MDNFVISAEFNPRPVGHPVLLCRRKIAKLQKCIFLVYNQFCTKLNDFHTQSVHKLSSQKKSTDCRADFMSISRKFYSN